MQFLKVNILLCLAPYQFYNMYYSVARNCDRGWHVLDDNDVFILGWFERCLNVLNSAINPVIYSVTHVRYRQAFFTALGCIVKKRNVNKPLAPAIGAAKTRSDSVRD